MLPKRKQLTWAVKLTNTVCFVSWPVIGSKDRAHTFTVMISLLSINTFLKRYPFWLYKMYHTKGVLKVIHISLLIKSLCQSINPRYSNNRKTPVMGIELYTTSNVQNPCKHEQWVLIYLLKNQQILFLLKLRCPDSSVALGLSTGFEKICACKMLH